MDKPSSTSATERGLAPLKKGIAGHVVAVIEGVDGGHDHLHSLRFHGAQQRQCIRPGGGAVVEPRQHMGVQVNHRGPSR